MTDATPNSTPANADDTLVLRPGSARGRTSLDWLDSRHTFSFGSYRSIEHMGFHDLRVINDDRIAPGGGFGEHPHQDMEIITWVLEGSLKHADSLGHESVLQAHELQVMTAGRGIRHSEFNDSPTQPVHLIQIWLKPREKGLEPRYDQRAFEPQAMRNNFRLVVSPDGEDDSLTIAQDANLYIGQFDANRPQRLRIAPGRAAWFHIAQGSVDLAGHTLVEGDGAALTTSGALEMRVRDEAQVLFFDLPAK